MRQPFIYISIKSILCSFEITNNIAKCDEKVKIFIGNGYIELFFAKKSKISLLERVDAEIVNELGVHGDLRSIYAKFLN